MKKDLNANELDIAVVERMRDIDFSPIWHHFDLVGDGQKLELLDKADHSNRYYQWLAGLVSVVKPKQIVELGAAAGISTAVMALFMPKNCKLYSVDIDPSIAWKWMKQDYPNVTKILGDDLNMAIWPGDVDLGKTDIWFIDSLHTYDQLSAELELYKPYFKRGAIVVLDDIRMKELEPIWEGLKYDKCETSTPNHHTGFGHFIV